MNGRRPWGTLAALTPSESPELEARVTSQHPSDRRLLQQALAHHQAGRLDAAERLYREILARATYRCKRYEKHLAPVMDKLAPHIGYFGYGE